MTSIGLKVLLDHATRLARLEVLGTIKPTTCVTVEDVAPLLCHLRAAPRELTMVDKTPHPKHDRRTPGWRLVLAALDARKSQRGTDTSAC